MRRELRKANRIAKKAAREIRRVKRRYGIDPAQPLPPQRSAPVVPPLTALKANRKSYDTILAEGFEPIEITTVADVRRHYIRGRPLDG